LNPFKKFDVGFVSSATSVLMGSHVAFDTIALEVHDDDAKELDAGLRPLDHYKQVNDRQSLAPETTRADFC
jgi:hypothetical protein